MATVEAQLVRGTGASAGIAIGPLLVLEHESVEVPDHPDPAAAVAGAVAEVAADLRARAEAAEAADRAEAGEVLKAQALMAEDAMLADAVRSKLDGGATLDTALTEAGAELSAMLASLDDPYLAARAADVSEVVVLLERNLAGLGPAASTTPEVPSILCAPSISAADTAGLDPSLVLGIVTEEGGATSHVAIIARALGIPAVVGVDDLPAVGSNGATTVIDGTAGELWVAPDPDRLADFRAKAAAAEAERAAAERYRGIAVTFDGRPVGVAANVAGQADLERAIEAAADGIGLMRTEFLYFDRADAPGEEEQFEWYRQAVSSFDAPVVIRLFDIGGDKPLDYLMPDPGPNPFLGVRGVRLYPQAAALLTTQLRALLRAAVAGDLWVMVPMVATVAEMVEVRRLVDEARATLEREGIDHGSIRLGTMVEVPSAALIATALAEVADFFSIGTNDLTQYAMAADRTNGELDHLQDPVHPAVLSLCRLTASAGRSAGIPVAVCGEAAADPVAAALFAEMGIGKLSVAPPSVNPTKAVVAGLDAESAAAVAHQVESAADAAAVRSLVAPLLGAP
ncbi:MAG: phosphoenolpyruvate--protein phosphotransferase [Actinomycetota bacterium]